MQGSFNFRFANYFLGHCCLTLARLKPTSRWLLVPPQGCLQLLPLPALPSDEGKPDRCMSGLGLPSVFKRAVRQTMHTAEMWPSFNEPSEI